MNCGVKSTEWQQQPVLFWGDHDICSWTTEMYTGPMFSSCCGGYVLESWRNRYTTNASNNMYLIVFYGEETRARVRSDVGRSHNLSHNQKKKAPNRRCFESHQNNANYALCIFTTVMITGPVLGSLYCSYLALFMCTLFVELCYDGAICVFNDQTLWVSKFVLCSHINFPQL
jgi:hypothetical protein